jgi:predicted porin
MKFIKFIMAAAVAIFSLQFSSAAAATTVKAVGTSLHTGSTASAQQHRVHHRARHLHRIHRHRR